MSQILGERFPKWDDRIRKFEERHWLEDGVSAWSSPSLLVLNNRPGEIGIVMDYREVNYASVTDAHPLPTIEDIFT